MLVVPLAGQTTGKKNPGQKPAAASIGDLLNKVGSENGPLFTRTAKPTQLQARALQLIGVEVT